MGTGILMAVGWATVDIQNKIWFSFKLLYIIHLHMHVMIYLSNKIPIRLPTGAQKFMVAQATGILSHCGDVVGMH